MDRCMICSKRPAQAFGPYKVEDLLCEECATDPREAHDRLMRGVRNGLWITAAVAVVLWVAFSLLGGGR